MRLEQRHGGASTSPFHLYEIMMEANRWDIHRNKIRAVEIGRDSRCALVTIHVAIGGAMGSHSGGSAYLPSRGERIIGGIRHPEYGYLRASAPIYEGRDVRTANDDVESESGESVYLKYA